MKNWICKQKNIEKKVTVLPSLFAGEHWKKYVLEVYLLPFFSNMIF